ncbi:GNAT family N-acetyltransferase [Ferruginibacter sp. SUN106]|uniref:GNAT family N-acetyltransferase n=1 Tax=Ferruginibacter sp. SUN106 TaxID=2978348 RepID=UPI003D36FBCD
MTSKTMQTLNITTERLIIRNLKPADLNDFHIYRSNPEVTKYQGFDVMTIEQASQFIEEQKDKQFGNAGEWVQYAIENKETKKLVGDCAIKLDEHNTDIAEIGITISHLSQKNGYAREVLSGILDFLFNEINIHRVVETVDAENTASINLLKSVGFREEGHFIENIFFKGSWGSEFQYAMLKREWDSKHAATDSK